MLKTKSDTTDGISTVVAFNSNLALANFPCISSIPARLLQSECPPLILLAWFAYFPSGGAADADSGIRSLHSCYSLLVHNKSGFDAASAA